MQALERLAMRMVARVGPALTLRFHHCAFTHVPRLRHLYRWMVCNTEHEVGNSCDYSFLLPPPCRCWHNLQFVGGTELST